MSGTISSDTTFANDETTTIVGEVIVAQGVTLTIESGAVVEFDGNYSFTVNGTLSANGSSSEQITFTSASAVPSPGEWGSISLTSESSPNTTIKHTLLQYASDGIDIQGVGGELNRPVLQGVTVENVSGRGIELRNAAATIEQTTVRNFGSGDGGSGIFLRGEGAGVATTLDGVSVSQQQNALFRTGECVRVRDGADVSITASTLRACNQGLRVKTDYHESPPTVEVSGTAILENNRGVQVSTWNGQEPYPQVTATGNDITGNSDWNVYIDGGSDPESTTLNFTDTWWGTTDSTSVASTIRDRSDNSDVAAIDFIPLSEGANGAYGIADINEDGQTDGFDLSILAAAFGAQDGEDGFNPDADLDSDDRIDGFDLSILGTRFGTVGPQTQHATPVAPSDTSGPTRLIVSAEEGSYAAGDTIKYRIKVESVPELFSFSGGFSYEAAKLEYVGFKAGNFLSQGGRAEILPMAQGSEGSGTLGITRTRSGRPTSPMGDGHVASLRFVARTSLSSPPKLGLKDIGLIGPVGRETYDFTLEGAGGLPDRTEKPGDYRLLGNYPNPFTTSTTIQYVLPEEETVTIAVYDVVGRKVTTLVNQRSMSAGRHKVHFRPHSLSSGVYFYRMETSGRTKVRRMVLTK